MFVYSVAIRVKLANTTAQTQNGYYCVILQQKGILQTPDPLFSQSAH